MIKFFLMVAALLVGIILSYKAMNWINNFTYGENRRRLEKEKRSNSAE
jgi:hypothetical protein